MTLTYAPIVVAPLPVAYDAGPKDTEPQRSPKETPPQPKTRIPTKFEAQALYRLEVEFGINQNPTTVRRKLLASQLAKPLSVITCWYQNRRNRERRQERPAPKPKSAHPILMSSTSERPHSMSSPGFSPPVTPPPAKRFRSWSVEAVPSPEGVSLSDVGYSCHPSMDGSSLDSSSTQDSSSQRGSSLGSFSRDSSSLTSTSSLGSSYQDSSSSLGSSYQDRSTSLDSSSQSADSRCCYITYTSHSSFSSGEMSLEGDSRLQTAGPSAVRPVVIVPDVFSPAMDHPQPSQTWAPQPSQTWAPQPSQTWAPHPSQTWAGTPGAFPCEDVFHDMVTPPSPATPGEVFSPTLRIAQQAWYGDHNNNDQTYAPCLPPHGRLQAASTVQDAGLVTLTRPRLDATFQPTTPLPAPTGQETYPPTPLPAPTGQETYPPTPPGTHGPGDPPIHSQGHYHFISRLQGVGVPAAPPPQETARHIQPATYRKPPGAK